MVDGNHEEGGKIGKNGDEKEGVEGRVHCKEIMKDIMESVSKSEGEKRIQSIRWTQQCRRAR